jgi:predicted lipid-binding transport protein (Tim44 family)
VLSWIQPLIAGLVLGLYGLVFGAIVGAVMGLVLYALQRGRRDFTAVTSLQPTHYDIVADVAVADRAQRLLGGVNDRRE